MSCETNERGCPLMEEPALSENARTVLEARYLKKNEAGECIEKPGSLFRRVARTVAEVELAYGASEDERDEWEGRFYRLMTSKRFMPNSPTLMNAGREMGMLSACFVLPVRDSVVDIFNSIKHTALIQKAGGGTGFAFDELRPTGDYIHSSGGTTSGPITFWRAFSEATNAIQQGAFRRGANMGMMYIHHPDILKFLYAKQDLNQFTNYNISVKLTDTWMEELRADPASPHVTRNPRNGKAFAIPRDVDIWEYDVRTLIEVDCVEPVGPDKLANYYTTPRLTGPLPEEFRGKVYTKGDIWKIITQNAWQTGEPGVVFIDRINAYNPTPHLGRIEATNPCGEQPLLPYEACNLGSVNLGRFVREACTPQAHVDWDGLRQTVREAVRFLDNVIDANSYPLAEIDAICRANRKIGLGIMGFADALFALGVPYNSEEGVAWGQRFMAFVNEEAHACSEELARARGCFPNWAGSVWDREHGRRMRNAAVTTVAPTGTISIIAECTGGVEPLFALAFVRNVLRGQLESGKSLIEVNEVFRRVSEARGSLSEGLLERLVEEGTLANIEGVPEDVRRVFVCAHDVAPEWHLRMQAAFQRHCDSSISKTINFPAEASVADVERIYHRAFELGCKGVTVYRDGSRQEQPMALQRAAAGSADTGPAASVSGTAEDCGDLCTNAPEVPRPERAAVSQSRRFIEPADLAEIVSGLRIRQMTPFGNMHVKITVDPREQRELEVFAQLGKGGDVATSDLEAICRMVSLWLRAGGSLRHVIKQLEGIGSSLQIPTRAGRIGSLGDGLACALKKYTRAKERFGLRALLLGEIDLAELDKPHPAPHGKEAAAIDRTVSGTDATAAPLPPKTPRRKGNGAGRESSAAGGGDGGAVNRLRGAAPGRLSEAFEPEAVARPAAPVSIAGGKASGGGGVSVEADFTTRVAAVTTVADDEGLVETIDLAEESEAVASPAERRAPRERPAVLPGLRELLATVQNHHDAARNYLLKCPQCGGRVARQEGCLHCANHCGWGAC